MAINRFIGSHGDNGEFEFEFLHKEKLSTIGMGVRCYNKNEIERLPSIHNMYYIYLV